MEPLEYGSAMESLQNRWQRPGSWIGLGIVVVIVLLIVLRLCLLVLLLLRLPVFLPSRWC